VNGDFVGRMTLGLVMGDGCLTNAARGMGQRENRCGLVKVSALAVGCGWLAEARAGHVNILAGWLVWLSNTDGRSGMCPLPREFDEPLTF